MLVASTTIPCSNDVWEKPPVTKNKHLYGRRWTVLQPCTNSILTKVFWNSLTPEGWDTSSKLYSQRCSFLCQDALAQFPQSSAHPTNLFLLRQLINSLPSKMHSGATLLVKRLFIWGWGESICSESTLFDLWWGSTRYLLQPARTIANSWLKLVTLRRTNALWVMWLTSIAWPPRC